MTLYVPPLRERPQEIPILARLFIQRISEIEGRRELPRVTDDAMVQLCAYAWPGNVRELRNVIERALYLSNGRFVQPEHLPLRSMVSTWPAPVSPPIVVFEPSLGDGPGWPGSDLGDVQAVERHRILAALEQSDGDTTQAAQRVGLAHRSLQRRLAQYEIDVHG